MKSIYFNEAFDTMLIILLLLVRSVSDNEVSSEDTGTVPAHSG